ncbi:EamA family transporter RarD [Shewanella dokdonensis]|uniref:EamA family transporter RarD n=1 Tax=Shewanella dokdonensis TaxID=712036 RepID=A0ABX8DIK8_9GAMM|nr:EamA family transporter RarD [Shewanella dokdonensis]MCL1076448.1 EamA family transporter RarD [Shewanella dokdonensis]QVK24339.1 EamA family transporter RarD [Shewanella dokdonensis]
MAESEYRKGIILALCAYIFWGFAPLYFKLLHDVSPIEILIHRIIWSFILMGIMMSLMGGFGHLRALLRRPKQLSVLLVTSILIAGNWLLFIWAVNNDHLLDASLGYFINPLFNVMLGLIFLSERLNRWQWLAVFLAALGVVIQLLSFGSIPLVSLGLAATFGFYALFRKKVNVDAATGLLVETAVLVPPAILYVILGDAPTTSHMLANGWQLNLLLIAAGVITTIPLLCFAGAAVRIPLSTLGFFQYVGPSIMFIMAITWFHEQFDMEKSITFGFIWAALAIFTSNMLLRRNRG